MGGATEEIMGLYRGEGRYRRDHGSLSEGGLQRRPWVSIEGRRGYRRDHGPLSGVGGGGATEEIMGLYRGEGGYRRDHGSLSGGGGLQVRPWVSTRGRGGGGKTETVGLFKGVGGYKRRPSSPLILVGPELV